MRILCRIETEILEREFGILNTDEVVVTEERLRHIRGRHPDDFALFERYVVGTVSQPDFILRDEKNESTVFMVARLESINVNAVVRLSLAGKDDTKNKNSVMTFFRLRDRNLEKLIKKNRVLYSKPGM